MEKRSSDKGFGLFSIRERLRLLNGELRIISKPGQGAEIERPDRPRTWHRQ